MQKGLELDAFCYILFRDTFPATFRDAIRMTRILGIRYLWIDPLCTIQNGTNDWQKEPPRMGAAYENAYLTIAAVSAADDTEGFLG
ncbi:hypothetical protein F4802DRAFT_590359 [Xylaria palmicola]|nr:hypothetical protein F4802DRAFT_590359 [Xylaria palmicola]